MPALTLPLDLTGESANNKRTGEVHAVSSVEGHMVALNYGCFFTESLVVRKTINNQVLLPGVDYVPLHLNKDATIASGKEICTLISFTNQTIIEDVSFDYQAIGGSYSINIDAIKQLFLQLQADERPTTWGSIVQVPNQFPPAAHLHYLGDMHGWEGFVKLLEEIRVAILHGDRGARDAIFQYLNRRLNIFQAIIDGMNNQRWPVGSVYFNATSAVNPGDETMLGIGTWVRYAEGKVLVSQQTGDAQFGVLGSTGGSKVAKVVQHEHGIFTSTTESRDHTHGVNGRGNDNNSETVSGVELNSYSAHDGVVTTGGPSRTHTHKVNITDGPGLSAEVVARGTNTANLQPYIVVYMWVRTA